MPSENIVVRNITVEPQFTTFATDGLAIGSEMSGGVRNVTFSQITLKKVGCASCLFAL